MTESWVGAPVADRVLEEVRAAVTIGQRAGRRPPFLVSVHRGESTPFGAYLKQQVKVAERAGIGFRSVALRAGGSDTELRSIAEELNRDPEVDGVLLEHPLPPELRFDDAIATLDPRKDVDGVGILNLGLLMARRPGHVPAVARAAVRIASHYGVSLAGRRVAVVGRSETVGLPLALLLLARGEHADATVTIAHSRTSDLAEALRGCDVLFSCAGHPGLLNRKVVPHGASVIDVGLSVMPDDRRASGVRSVGDADATDLEGWASALTPVPGGVGPVTAACLMENVIRAWNWSSVSP